MGGEIREDYIQIYIYIKDCGKLNKKIGRMKLGGGNLGRLGFQLEWGPPNIDDGRKKN